MAIVAGVDFGTQSVRVSVVDSVRGRLGSGAAEYPVKRRRDDPDYAVQAHEDHMKALGIALREAVEASGVNPWEILSLAIDTTGSTVVPVDENLAPLDDYYLWCDHRSKKEAALITESAHREGLEVINWYGGTYSSEWGFAKVLHWLRNNPEKRGRMATALEHCDMAAAVLCGINNPADVPRSICSMGHKWMWNASLGGLPPDDFLDGLDPLMKGIRGKLSGQYATSDQLAGRLCEEWAGKLGLTPGIPVPVGAIDAHWDAIGAGIRVGDIVNVVGTSTCIMAIVKDGGMIPGVCGVVKGSIHPGYYGIEAGLAAVGDIFAAIAGRAGVSPAELASKTGEFRAGQTGLLRLTWDNGDRNVLVNPDLSGITLGWNLTHRPEDEFFAALEGSAFHSRIILERMMDYGVPVSRVINGGGIPQKNEVLNRVYANVFNKPVLVPTREVTSLGSAIFAFMAAGVFDSVEAAQEALCPGYRVVEPDPEAVAVYDSLYELYKKIYFSFGDPDADTSGLSGILSELRQIAELNR